MSSDSRTVLITGCSAGGIGHALAKEFHAKGIRVFATARRLSSLSELEDLGIMTLELDVTSLESIRRVRDRIAEVNGGKLDILVNNAGQGYSLSLIESDMARVRDLFEVNLFAIMSMVQEFAPLLMASKQGCIANIGSLAALLPVPFNGAYNASKAALNSFTDTLRIELAPFNIRVVNVSTGDVVSNLVKPHSLPEGSLYKPMEDLYLERQRDLVARKGAMPTADYARTVVGQILRNPRKSWIWAGSHWFLCWFIDAFLPRGTFGVMLSKVYGLNKFARRLKRSHAKTT